ncbi:RNA methyltransferase [Paenibacillus sepulcri]
MNRIRYMATVLPGIEAVLADEMTRKIPEARIKSIKRGKIFFETDLPARDLLSLRTADNIYRVICCFSVGLHRSDLPRLQKNIAACDLSFADTAGLREGGFVVNASRKGAHSYSRFEAAEAAICGIGRHYPRWRKGSPESHGCEFRLDIDDDAAVFSFRMTDSTFRYRSRERIFTPGALRPTVAHALVWLSSPQPADRIIDPCCGSGTLVGERLAYPLREIRGGDCSANAVQASRHNLPGRFPAAIHQWDARNLPIDNGWASTIISNLAFGRQIGQRESLQELYGALLREMSRLLDPAGRAVLLAEDGALLRSAAEQYGLDCTELMRISLKGIQPAIYRLTK